MGNQDGEKRMDKCPNCKTEKSNPAKTVVVNGTKYLKIARKDLEAAKCLFDRKLYPQSIFYLQQAIEKAVKSFGIWNKTITEAEAKKTIGHRAWKVYFKIFDEFKNKVLRLEEVLKKFPELREAGLVKEFEINRLKELEKYQSTFSNEDDAFNISFSMEKLQEILLEINKLKNELEGISFEKFEIDEKKVEDLKKEFYQLLEAISKINPTINLEDVKKRCDKLLTPQLISEIFRALSKPISEIIYCYLSLFYLSLIFSPHAVRSRYPQGNFDPLEVYDEKLPLIRMYNYFAKIVEEVLEKLDHVYFEIPRKISLR